jgi:sterol desaturase/sphingolipid hydroxylase (fatty acid hydroxylase superfamily)
MTMTGRPESVRGFEPPPIVLPPLFRSPPEPGRMARWWVTKFMWPQSLLWIGIAVVAWNFLTPDFDRMATLRPGWIALIYARNVAVMLVVIGGLHLRLHIRRSQGTRYKYDLRWLATNRSSFLFGNQTRDNMFWSLVSGGLIATAYEAFVLWMYANDRVPHVGFAEAPLYVVMITFLVFVIEGFHFYGNHRLLHWEPLYRRAHSLHHRNVNTGPWSGISMHPLEHVLYFSLPLVFLVIPASPFVIAFCGIYLMLSPSPSHSGFDRFVLPDGSTLHGGDYFHNLHHRYFECNYGMLLVPLDKWAGTFHDGTPEAHRLMRERMRQRRRAVTDT